MIAHGTRYVLRPLSIAQQELWDTFVSTHPCGNLLQSWRWGDLKAFSGWSPLRLALWDGARIVAGAQVLCKTAAHVPLRLAHIAYIPRGPVVDWSQPDVCMELFTRLHAYLKSQGAIAVRIEPDVDAESPEYEQLARYFAARGARRIHSIQPLRTIVVDLAGDESALLARMKEKWRYNIRLGGRRGVAVRIADSPDDVRAWYDIYQTTSDRDKFGIHTFEYYLRVWNLFAPSDTLRLYLAEYEGKLLAGIFVSVYAGQGCYLYGASSNEERHLMPNYVLQWEAIRWVRSAGASLYDLWGIPATDDENEEMTGVYRFKRGWGGRVKTFAGGYEYVYRPLLMCMVARAVR